MRLLKKEVESNMPKIHKQNCKNCGEYYEGVGQYFCSQPCAASGENNNFYGKKHKKETIEKNRQSHLGKHYSPQTEFKKGQFTMEKHHNWQGGISFEPYGIEFNEELREQVRTRDNRICQECNYIEDELGYKLNVHHIDYDKQNNDPNNLISLCKSCNVKANYNREDWTGYFRNKLQGKKICR
jgi:hypothetical protein